MPSTLLKYFFKRWGWPLLGGVLFFGGLLVANNLVRVSRDIFSQGASIRWLIPIILTSLPETLAMVLPMAAILGGLLGTQQLSEGSEMVASQGLGVGIGSILKPWALLSSMLVVIASVNANLIVPMVSSNMDKIEGRMVEEAKTRFLRPGASPYFPQNNPQTGMWVAPNGEVHLFEVTEDGVQHLVAKNMAWRREDDENNGPYALLNLSDLKGCYYQKSNQSIGLLTQQSQTLRFDIPAPSQILTPTPVRHVSTLKLIEMIFSHYSLYGTDNHRLYMRKEFLDSSLEIGRRISIPLAVVALMLFGIALGLEHPRFHKGGAILQSLGVIFLYYIVMKFIENRFLVGGHSPAILLIPPLIFFVASLILLYKKMKPHRSAHFQIIRTVMTKTKRIIEKITLTYSNGWDSVSAFQSSQSSDYRKNNGILGVWTRRLWWRSWGATFATLLTLDLVMEFVPIAGDLPKSGISYGGFLSYWLWNLPTFLALAFPISFLLGGVMAFSDAAIAREWVALKAGGASLLQWITSGARAWITVIFITFVVQAVIAPVAVRRADNLSRMIRNRPIRVFKSKPWMHLTSTDVLWFLEKDYRWGFTLKPPGEGPILYRWKRGEARVDELPWDALQFTQGEEATAVFPDKALRDSARAEEASTIDLLHWQKWAPDPERGTMLWGRLLNWLAGPCLMFAMLAYTFPAPRRGRGQVLSISLVVGLLFLGMQALFSGAAKAGEIPALWGVLAPLLLLLGYGLFNLNRLRT
jgi:lipopolysaccharide export LptBFGC system permease protein LptF